MFIIPSRFAQTVGVLVVMAATASAQSLGTFRWQQQPFCNLITVNVVQAGSVYHLDGTDDQCGAATAASVSGLAFPNPNGTIGFGMTIVNSPGGAPTHIDATITLATLGGTWRDSAGGTGNWTFTAGAGTGGSARPAAGAPPKAFFLQNAGFVDLPTGAATTNVLTLNLPVGTYFIAARGEINNNGATTQIDTVECRIVAGTATAELFSNTRLNISGQDGDTETAAGFVVSSYAAAGTAVLRCTTTAGWSAGNLINPQLVAVAVRP